MVTASVGSMDVSHSSGCLKIRTVPISGGFLINQTCPRSLGSCLEGFLGLLPHVAPKTFLFLESISLSHSVLSRVVPSVEDGLDLSSDLSVGSV